MGFRHRYGFHRDRKDCGRRGRRRVPRMHRRLFFFSGLTIVLTALLVSCLFRLLSPAERFQQDREGLNHFISGRLAEIWHEPVARDRFVADLHRDLRLNATLKDAEGTVLSQHGDACSDPWLTVPVRGRQAALGELTVCGSRPAGDGWRFVLVLLVAMFVLWAVSGVFARLLLRPLRRLSDMARRVGEGDLEVRSGLSITRHGELGVLGMTMDEMVTRIGTQMKDQQELLAAVSHELRTPLGHLRILVEMARERPTEAVAGEIEAEVLEIDRLVGQLLASSRLDFDAINPRSVDPHELVDRALERAGIADQSAEIDSQVPGLVEVDPTLVSMALANLIANAQHHGDGLARIRLERSDDFLVFRVEDKGPGFRADEREKVFEPFYRGEHRAGTSLGLGLSLVQRIADAHGGRAWIEDGAEGGAAVCMSVRVNTSPSPTD